MKDREIERMARERNKRNSSSLSSPPFVFLLTQRIIIACEPSCSRELRRAMSPLFAQPHTFLTASYVVWSQIPSHSDLSFSFRETTANCQSATSLKTNSDIKYVPYLQNFTPYSLLSTLKDSDSGKAVDSTWPSVSFYSM